MGDAEQALMPMLLSAYDIMREPSRRKRARFCCQALARARDGGAFIYTTISPISFSRRAHGALIFTIIYGITISFCNASATPFHVVLCSLSAHSKNAASLSVPILVY